MKGQKKSSRPGTFRRWLLRRKVMERLAWGGVAFFTIVVLFYQVERWRGARAWESAKEDYLATGGTLVMKDLLPAAIPAHDNFGALPIFKEIAVEESSLGEQNRQKLEQAHLQPPGKSSTLGPRPNWFSDRENYFREYAAYLDLESEGLSSSEIAMKLLKFIDQKTGSVIQELEEGIARPKSQLCEHAFQAAEERLWIHYAIPHLMPILDAARTVHLRGLAGIETNNPAAAFSSVVICLRLRGLIQNEFMVGLVVAKNIDSWALDVVRYGIEKQIWSDDQLASFTQERDRMLTRKSFRSVLQMEVVGLLQTINVMKNSVRDRVEVQTAMAAMGETNSGFLHMIIPKGWYDLNKVELLRSNLPLLSKGRPGESLQELLSDIREREEKVEALGESLWPSTFIVSQVTFAISPFGERVIIDELKYELMRVSCAIERYRLGNNRLPAKLSDLVPRYLPESPLDPMDQAPLRYQIEGKSGYRLYSIGVNQHDDGGTPRDPSKRPSEGSDVVWSVRSSGL